MLSAFAEARAQTGAAVGSPGKGRNSLKYDQVGEAVCQCLCAATYKLSAPSGCSSIVYKYVCDIVQQ